MTSITSQDMQRDPMGVLRRVEQGEAVLVLRGDKPVAEIKPVPPAADRPARPSGLAKGRFVVPDDFDHPLPDTILRDFEGR